MTSIRTIEKLSVDGASILDVYGPIHLFENTDIRSSAKRTAAGLNWAVTGEASLGITIICRWHSECNSVLEEMKQQESDWIFSCRAGLRWRPSHL